MSANKLRQKQHKPAREKQKARELADLKRQNHQLQRQVARVRKQATQAINAHFEPMFSAMGVERSVPVNTEPQPITREVLEEAVARLEANHGAPQTRFLPKGSFCPTADCNTELRLVELGRKDFLVCPVCKYRRAQST